jgi:glycosyltransferase involved in cell wall biosynthesis
MLGAAGGGRDGGGSVDVTSVSPSAPVRVVVVVKGWPRLSETFIAQEILGLERRGLRQTIVALRRPTDGAVHAFAGSIAAPVHYLPEYLREAPGRVWRAVRAAGRRPGFGRALRAWLADLIRDPTPSRVRRFGQACVLAAELPPDAGWLHSHFLHTPASVTRYAAAIAGLPWSFSAHAKDIWTSPEWDKRRKLADARWGVTCTAFNHAHLAGLAPEPARVERIYHGLDLKRFPPVPPVRAPRDGSDPAHPVRLLSVGRAVDKKGFDLLIDALSRLPPGLAWTWTHIGGGDRLADLKAQAGRAGLTGRIVWRGAQPQDTVIAAMREADLFVLPCRQTADGDRDGLPNVLMEAQTQGLACLSTRLSAIPELIQDGVTGTLVLPGNALALAGALVQLIRSPGDRAAQGTAGAARVRAAFTCEGELDRLMVKFTRSLELS